MERVCQRIGVPWNPTAFPMMKIGFRPKAKSIASLYTQRSAKIVRDRFDFEFEFFGYPPRIKDYIAAAGTGHARSTSATSIYRKPM
jgi:hypothetical protein